jgi:hypothetical protein
MGVLAVVDNWKCVQVFMCSSVHVKQAVNGFVKIPSRFISLPYARCGLIFESSVANTFVTD